MPSRSKLISKGSEGCIFVPGLPCKTGKINKKDNKTKLLLQPLKSTDNEYEITKLISKIPNNDKWAITWSRKCISKPYKELVKVSDVKKCVMTAEDTLVPDKTQYQLLQGKFEGQTSYHYLHSLFKESVFKDNSRFVKSFHQLVKCLEPLFMANVSLEKHKLCHHDIKKENVIFKEGKFYLIDFGLSFHYDDAKQILSRMKEEFLTSRIYEVYSFEYIYYPPLSQEEMVSEQEDIALHDFRKDYDLQGFIHQKLFHRDMDHLRFELLEDKLHKVNKPNLKGLMSKIDTYSLGMLVPTMFYDITHDLSLDESRIHHLLKLKEVRPFMDLFKDMTEIDYRKRISPEEADKRYKNLISSMVR